MRSHIRADDKIAARIRPSNGGSSPNENLPCLSRRVDAVRRIAFSTFAVEALRPDVCDVRMSSGTDLVVLAR
jgi:hypothetical protein